MKKSDLKIIKGGLSSNIDMMRKDFVSAYVTDTRLMGVLAVYARWNIAGPSTDFSGEPDQLHQFFYIDCEEAGLETYTSHPGTDIIGIEITEQALVGGLGAKRVDLNERSLRGLLCHWRKFNVKHNLPLPENYSEYGFLLEPETVLTSPEQHSLMEEICSELVSDYQLINYFLMRCFGRDYDGARFLTASAGDADKFPLDLYDSYIQATFCKNVIDVEKKYGDGSISYLCESLIEMNGKYETVISKVVAKDRKVIGFEHCSGFRVSEAEAAMMLAKPEFMTICEVMLSEDDMKKNLGEFTVGLNTVMSKQENGHLFMAFKESNSHVNNRVFMLSNDVKGVYFLSDYGQLIVTAYSLRDIRKLEATLAASPLSPYLVPTAKYEFIEPLLFEFIQSDFDDFETFLDFLQE